MNYKVSIPAANNSYCYIDKYYILALKCTVEWCKIASMKSTVLSGYPYHVTIVTILSKMFHV